MCSAKLALYVLSTCSLCELYKSVFSLGADHNNCMSRLRLQALLLKIVEMTTFLGEENSYGTSLISKTIDDCFYKVIFNSFLCEANLVNVIINININDGIEMKNKYNLVESPFTCCWNIK